MSQEHTVEERRFNKSKSLFYSLFMRRRKNPQKNHYVDVHESKLFVLIVSVLFLCAADAYLTTIILNHGGKELNPLMDILLKHDILVFFYAKFFVTAGGLLFFLVHKNFVFFHHLTGYHLLFACLVLYVSLFIYEIYLISAIPDVLFS